VGDVVGGLALDALLGVLAALEDAISRVRSDTAESIAHQRIKRVRWFKEWLEGEIAEMEPPDPDADLL
jgi:uncharacterized protein